MVSLLKRATTKTLFVTVGTTRFDELVEAVTTIQSLQWMDKEGFTHLIIQYGAGNEPIYPPDETLNVQVESYDFRPSLKQDMERADLVLSHAGAGTVMEALSLQKKLVVVINTRLMDNHQTELASAMAKRNHLFVVNNPQELSSSKVWDQFLSFSPVPHSRGDPMEFPRLLDDTLGFFKGD